ncbi:hypothetical protein M422DRAFT_38160 [Sphaerobolus stellatus SS14]|uniref:Uncharacterized protein n=1 Tax=Sphaerobolus stellatus (strain SS14) TaxID=990650 RepID=A0A0C9UM57_SPHS4|nr:hypothetical protein M422DRAFT_38160 [Sphaerobolus stellatus SS14]
MRLVNCGRSSCSDALNQPTRVQPRTFEQAFRTSSGMKRDDRLTIIMGPGGDQMAGLKSKVARACFSEVTRPTLSASK